MAENTLPKKNVAYTFYVALVDTSNRPDLKANPTLAAGDVQVSTDGGSFGNLATLPVVTPASGVGVKVDLSAGEMNGDNTTVKFIDAAGAEWDDLFIEIRPATRKAEDLAYPTTTGRSIDVAATGEVGLDFGNAVGAITGAEIGVGAFASAAITADAIATNAIGAAELATDAIGDAQIATGAIAATAFAAGAIDAAAIAADSIGASELATDAIGAAQLAADAVDKIVDQMWDELMSDHQVDASFGLGLQVLDAGTATAGSANTITLDAGTASTTADLINGSRINLVGGTGAGQTRRVIDYSTTTLIATVEPNWITNPASGTKYAVVSGGNADLRTATQTSIDAIETDTASLNDTKIPDTISLAAINAECDTAISDAALATAADLLDKLGAVNEAAAAGDPSATESVMQYVKQIVNVLTGADGITTMPAAAAPANNVSIAEMVRSIYDDTNSLDGTKIPDTVSLANINAEVDTALTTTTYAEQGQETPPTTASLEEKIGYLYKAWLNRSNQTATTYQLFNTNATTVDQKSTVSDDATTAEKGAVVSGV